MKIKLGRIVAGAAATVALVLGSSAVAMADATASYTNGGIVRSEAYYNASQNRAYTTDKYNDGWGSRVRWELNAGGGGSKDNINGAGSTDYANVSAGSSTKVRIKSCSVNNGIEIGCGSLSAYVNV